MSNIEQQQVIKRNLISHLCGISFMMYLVSPIIYSQIIVFVFLDLFVSVYQWIKFLMFFCLLIYVVRKKEFELVSWFKKPLFYSLILFPVIGFGQFVFQRTIGGPLWFLGERTFSSTTPGIASAEMEEKKSPEEQALDL